MIKVVNMRDYRKETGWELVKVDRSSVLGNPFRMRRNDRHERRRVCDEYEKMFYYILSHPLVETLEPVPGYRINCKAFRNEVEKLAVAVYEGRNIALGCWCFPLKCHALTISSFVRDRATELEFNDPPMPDEDETPVPDVIQEELQGKVIMALTQYDLFSDYLDRCTEFGIFPWMDEDEYIEFFNDFWVCDYKDALAFHHKNEAPFDTTNQKEFVPGTSQDAVNEANNTLHRLPTQAEMQNVTF